MADDLLRYLQDQRTAVDSHLQSMLRLAEGCPAALMATLRFGLLAPGKRLRPILVVMAADPAGGPHRQAVPGVCAGEVVHAYSLIHDDLPARDGDGLRRGQPTCHKQFGGALAILTGDALLPLAFQVVAESSPPATAAACCRELA